MSAFCVMAAKGSEMPFPADLLRFRGRRIEHHDWDPTMRTADKSD
jgi:hypothetical protein